VKVKREPCRSEHDFYPNFYDSSRCGNAPLCCGATIVHCRRCGWYIWDCPCGSQGGACKISPKQERAIRLKRKQKGGHDAAR
jgi:hypothetical protein